jgi:hypothetical protein
MDSLIQLSKTTPVFLVALVCFGLSPTAQAVLPSPTPDGGYLNGNTAEGTNALINLRPGIGNDNTAIGFEALFMNQTGRWNAASGSRALHDNNGDANTATGNAALRDNKTGTFNTATGAGALRMNTTGSSNTADGFRALVSNQVGSNNTATGVNALFSNTSMIIGTDVISGDNNTANGWQALFNNIVGSENTAVGAQALYNNIGDLTGNLSNIGRQNSAFGIRSLFKNKFGSQNTAIGVEALFNLEGLTIGEDGDRNSALGSRALSNNTHGSGNVAVGASALGSATLATNQRTDPEENTAVGASALSSNTDGVANTAIGVRALASLERGENNIALGQGAGSGLTMGDSDNIDIGHPGVAGDNFTIRIGTNGIEPTHKATFIAGISGAEAIGGDAVYITTDGKLGTLNMASSAHFKKEIKPMDKASEAILALKPVTFRYKEEFDPKRIPQFGLVAEEVEKVNPDLVRRDRDGNLQAVRYAAVNAMLLNEFLKEHHKVEEHEKTIVELKSGMTALAATVKEQAARIQKVSAQLEESKPAPQVVNNP